MTRSNSSCDGVYDKTTFWYTEVGNNFSSLETYKICSSLFSLPSSKIVPEVASKKPAKTFKKVLLPEPDGPLIKTRSPGEKKKDTEENILLFP